tara:strand:+ start:939 stop:1082 length:144 start_codon:yes stop_codon:yes gene_type:complete
MTGYDIMFIIVAGLLGFVVGVTYCNMTYVRYKKTIDSMRIIQLFKKT